MLVGRVGADEGESPNIERLQRLDECRCRRRSLAACCVSMALTIRRSPSRPASMEEPVQWNTMTSHFASASSPAAKVMCSDSSDGSNPIRPVMRTRVVWMWTPSGA